MPAPISSLANNATAVLVAPLLLRSDYVACLTLLTFYRVAHASAIGRLDTTNEIEKRVDKRQR